MKSIVGIVAICLSAGCGVGVGDPEGEAAAGLSFAQTTQAVIEATGATTDASGGVAQTSSSGFTSAPQDPIPARTPQSVQVLPLPAPAHFGGATPGL